MMADQRKNIKVTEEFYREHKPRKDELGLTWEEYIEGQAPELEQLLRDVVRDEVQNVTADLPEQTVELLRSELR